MKCVYLITDSNFTSNSASSSGGAIKYNIYRPTMSGLVFTNNSAQYGADIASYAIKVVRHNSSNDQVVLSGVGSGVQYDEVLILQAVDHDGNVMVLDDTSQISITPTTSQQTVLGSGVKKLTNGQATFDNLIFVSNPGDEHIEFRLSSKAVDATKIQLQYGVSSLQDSIDVSFRWCQPGEMHVSNTCMECPSGSYSVKWNSTVCENCMDNAA